MKRMLMFSGGTSVGKTAVIKALIPIFQKANEKVCVCKIDCLQSDDQLLYQAMHVPCTLGLSDDICPDHFLVSNLPEIWKWSDEVNSDLILIESAGLCHRCSPTTKKSVGICVLDCTSSLKSPQKLGPMVTQADMIVLTKIDMVSQAEREIIAWNIAKINPNAQIFYIDGLVGYGAELLAQKLLATPKVDTYENDILRHTMPSGVCSYCIGELRVGSAFQQGVVGKINFGGQKCSRI